jgi:hypothetical protein
MNLKRFPRLLWRIEADEALTLTGLGVESYGFSRTAFLGWCIHLDEFAFRQQGRAPHDMAR